MICCAYAGCFARATKRLHIPWSALRIPLPWKSTEPDGDKGVMGPLCLKHEAETRLFLRRPGAIRVGL